MMANIAGKIPNKPVVHFEKYEFRHQIMESGMVKGKPAQDIGWWNGKLAQVNMC